MRKVLEKVCPICGKVFETNKEDQIFCGIKCANSVGKRRKVESYDSSLEWQRVPSDQSLWQCPYQEWVACHSRYCNKCGWNPEVAKDRLEAVYEKGK